MDYRAPDLPDFTAPPLVEVALAVQFTPLHALRTPHIGLLWERFRDRFPKVDDFPVRDTRIETFGTRNTTEVSVHIERADIPLVPRVWFINDSGTEVIQIQHNRLVHNWRKVTQGSEYPRYEHISQAFIDELNSFQDFLAQEKVGEITPNQCEITYLNEIECPHDRIDDVVTVVKYQYSDAFLDRTEHTRLSMQYVISDDYNNQLGRLHISVQPMYRRSDRSQVVLLRLAARGAPQGDGVVGITRFMNIGREWLVRAFASITTEQMHQKWGRCDGS